MKLSPTDILLRLMHFSIVYAFVPLFFFTDVAGQMENKFFPPKNLMPTGVYYFPQEFPREEWGRDIKHIADLGFDFIVFGSCEWSFLEPQAGLFDFSWLDYCINEASKNKLKVLLSTPTFVTPVWLTRKHPEVSLVNTKGDTSEQGTLHNVNPTHPIFTYYAKRIIGQMGDRYGKDRRIWGWQLDPGPESLAATDYSLTNLNGYHVWLKDHYGSISILNHAWGADQNGSSYNGFDQIPLPSTENIVTENNFQSCFDFNSYASWLQSKVLGFQIDTLKKWISPLLFITANCSREFRENGLNPYQTSNGLHFVCSGFEGPGIDQKINALGAVNALKYSLETEWMRSVKGYSGILQTPETLVGYKNWNELLPSGTIRMLGWHSFALGEKFLCVFRFRAPSKHQSNYLNSILDSNGQAILPGGGEFIQASLETSSLKKFYNPAAKIPAEFQNRKVGILWKTSGGMSPGNENLSSYRLTLYALCKMMGAQVTIINTLNSASLDQYPFLLIPPGNILNSEELPACETYVKSGGNLLLMSGITGIKIPGSDSVSQEAFWQLTGAHPLVLDSLTNTYVKSDTLVTRCVASSYGLQPNEGTQILATYVKYSQMAAIVKRKVGKGSITTFGCMDSEGKLEKEIFRKVWIEAGVKILDLPKDVFVEWRDGYWIMLNYSRIPVKAPIQKKSRLLLGNTILTGNSVTVWMDE